MITEKQHKQICGKVAAALHSGLRLYTTSPRFYHKQILKVDDRIYIQGGHYLTHKSYHPETTYRDAMRRIEIERIPLGSITWDKSGRLGLTDYKVQPYQEQ